MIEVESHPPERRRRTTTLMVHGCCCCCCLHVVGGLAGAAFGSIRRNAPLPETLTTDAATRAEEEITIAHRLAAKVYWLVLAISTVIAAAIAALIDINDSVFSMLVVLFCLPAGQFLASGVTLIYVHSKPPKRKDECLSRLWKITLYGFLGALLGCVGLVATIVTMNF